MQTSLVWIDEYGPPKVLRYGTASLEPLSAREVRIRTLYAAVNHTGLEIRAGHWPVRKTQPFSYLPGVEVVGGVEGTGAAVAEWRVGQHVITMMHGLGGVRAKQGGGYAEHVTVDADALALVPGGVPPVWI